ncbi:MAG TPA: hypothetical protein VHD14_08880 [Pseudolabrys sp.]|nr:hypothetical protein [Pseudolabrys sp.]
MELTIEKETGTDRLGRDLERTIGKLRADIDRVEMLTAALRAFTAPVPEYEPRLRNVRLNLSSYELGTYAGAKSDNQNSPSSSRRRRSDASE